MNRVYDPIAVSRLRSKPLWRGKAIVKNLRLSQKTAIVY